MGLIQHKVHKYDEVARTERMNNHGEKEKIAVGLLRVVVLLLRVLVILFQGVFLRNPGKTEVETGIQVPEETEPVEEARKALEMFEEVSGEKVLHDLLHDDVLPDNNDDDNNNKSRSLLTTTKKKKN